MCPHWISRSIVQDTGILHESYDLWQVQREKFHKEVFGTGKLKNLSFTELNHS